MPPYVKRKKPRGGGRPPKAKADDEDDFAAPLPTVDAMALDDAVLSPNVDTNANISKGKGRGGARARPTASWGSRLERKREQMRANKARKTEERRALTHLEQLAAVVDDMPERARAVEVRRSGL